MIKGLFEAHLPVSDLDRSIKYYESLGLEFDHRIEGSRSIPLDRKRQELVRFMANRQSKSRLSSINPTYCFPCRIRGFTKCGRMAR